MNKSPRLQLRGINVRMRSQEVRELRKRLAQELWRNRRRGLSHYWPTMPPLEGIDRFAHLPISGDYERDEMLLAYKRTVSE